MCGNNCRPECWGFTYSADRHECFFKSGIAERQAAGSELTSGTVRSRHARIKGGLDLNGGQVAVAAPVGTEALTAGPLPAHWQKIMDVGSGKPYYYNDETKETTLDRPGGATVEEATAEATVEEATAAGSGTSSCEMARSVDLIHGDVGGYRETAPASFAAECCKLCGEM